MNSLTKLTIGLALLADLLLAGSSLSTELDWSWTRYVIKKVEPEYPRVLFSRGVKGSGVYRITINLKTGEVEEVKVLKSAKYSILNEYAAKALLQWRFRPGTVREATIPFDWEISGPVIRSFHY
jgi:TonB family protein